MRCAFRVRATSLSPDILLRSSRISLFRKSMYRLSHSALPCAESATAVKVSTTMAPHRAGLTMQNDLPFDLSLGLAHVPSQGSGRRKRLREYAVQGWKVALVL